MPCASFYTGSQLPSPHTPNSVSSWGTIHTTSPPQISSVNPAISGNGQITIDISMAATSQVKQHILNQPAFSPSLPRISLQAGPGRWSIPIENHSESGITVQDILTGIYSLYYTAIDQSQALGIPETALSNARLWADRRVLANPGSSNKIHRLDFLCGQTRLRGVSLSQDRSSCLIYMF